jgi:hypothetical protein
VSAAFQRIVGVLGAVAFLGLGGWGLQASVRAGLHARAVAGWPTVDGVVESSAVVDQRGQTEPLVVVRFVHEAQVRRLDRVAPDLFRGRGGLGRPAEVVARYPAGAAVPVLVDPAGGPEAWLEGGDAYPFLFPAVLCGLLVLLGLHTLVKTLQYQPGAPPRPTDPVRQRWVFTVLLSVVFPGIAVLSALDPGAAATWAGLFPAPPAGLSPTACAVLAMLGLGAPAPWFLWHLGGILIDARLRGKATTGVIGLGSTWLHAAGDPRQKRSAAIALVGLIYVVAVLAGFILLASARGV